MPNIKPHVEMFLMRDIRRIMFCAHDEQEHSLAWNPEIKMWVLQGKRQSYTGAIVHGIIRTIPNLVRGLSELERVSGNTSDKFTICDSPYYGD